MSPLLNIRKFVAYVLLYSLLLTGLLPLATRQSYASNNSLPHFLTPGGDESSQKTAPQSQTVDETKRARASQADNRLPLSFEENRGRAGRHVKYIARGAGYELFLTPTEAVLALRRSDGEKATTAAAADARGSNAPPHSQRARAGVVRMKLSGANPAPAVTGESKTGVRTKYAEGNDPQKRQANVARYERVRYAQVYPGVDMIYYGQQQQLKYDFKIAPGADAGRIALEFESIKRATVESETGELVLETAGGEVRQRKPVAYQEVEGERREVASWYTMKGKKRVSIEVGEYDRARPLVINPALSHSTYLSGNRQDSGTTLASDARTPDQSRQDQPVKKAGGGEYILSGYVTNEYGNGIEGVFMALDGSALNYTYTNANGFYSFGGLRTGGDYTVYASSDHYTFDPWEQNFYDLQSDPEASFKVYSTVDSSSISGTITNSIDGTGVGGVTLTLTCFEYPGEDCSDVDGRTTRSAGDGTYSFTGVPTPIHFLMITPTKLNYRFSPSEYFLFFVPSDSSEVDFMATPKSYAIIGVVRLGAARLPGVPVKLTSPTPAGFTPRTVMTNSGGAYAFDNLPPGRRYTVTPVQSDYQFAPASKSLAPLNAHQVGVDFSVKAYSITGQITQTGTTTGIDAVTLTLTSPTLDGFADRKVRTSSTGIYTFTNLPAGHNYTIKPMKSGIMFSPVTRSITNLSANIPVGAATNFTGTQ